MDNTRTMTFAVNDCAKGLLKEDACSLQELIEGCSEYPKCTNLCKDQGTAISKNQEHCVQCGELATYDISVAECFCPVGWRRNELFLINDAAPFSHDCSPCPKGSTVIPSWIIPNGERYHKTAGVEYTADAFSCASCPSGMEFNDEYQCQCKENHLLSGEAAEGPQMCIDETYMPTVSTAYSQVKFNFVSNGINGPTKSTTVNSIVISHFYLEAASRCEYYKSNSQSHVNSCENLLNLCVMSSYDETSAPCKELRIISRSRDGLIERLLYEKDSDDIIRDRTIKMKMSLREKEGHETGLDFRLVKYSMDGEFKGTERLENQFVSCIDGISSDFLLNNAEIPFGRTLNIEGVCDLNILTKRDTFFYELYLVDKGTPCGDGIDCLVPVPVLSTSYTSDGNTFPNMFEETSSSKFVRRFVLNDNLVRN